MPDSHDARPILIPPLVKANGALELVSERSRARRAVEHPHCDEHFLFTPHCAACIEAERTGYATATATPVEPSAKPSQEKPAPSKSSRSFGFTGNIPRSLTDEPTLAQQLLEYAVFEAGCDLADIVIDDLFS